MYVCLVLVAETAAKTGEGRTKAIRGWEREGTCSRAHPHQPQNAHNLAHWRPQIPAHDVRTVGLCLLQIGQMSYSVVLKVLSTSICLS